MESKLSVWCFLTILTVAVVDGTWPPDIPSSFVPSLTASGLHHEPPLSSPISLSYDTQVSVAFMRRLQVIDPLPGDDDSCITMKNNGRTLDFNVSPDCRAKQTLTGGILESLGKYRFVQMHMHWGCDDGKGSEHAVDEKKYPLEAHFVHVNNKYPDMNIARNYSDGLSVMGAFVGIVAGKDNPAASEMISKMALVRKAGSETRISGRSALWLFRPLMEDLNTYYAYPGSLTTPGWPECVTWIIPANLLLHPTGWMSVRQLKAFKALEDENGVPIKCNSRPLQSVNGRPLKLVISKMGVDIVKAPLTSLIG